jgi:acetoin utilization deacetylase AcuC-like enzyme
MGPGTSFKTWGDALADACRKIDNYAPDALVISLGVDTFENDPISFFKLAQTRQRRFQALRRDHRRPQPADPVHHGRRLRGRGNRPQRG